MSEYIHFDGVLGWLINLTTGRRERVNIQEGTLDEYGRVLFGTFTRKGKTLRIYTHGDVVNETDGDPIPGVYELYINEKWLKEDRTRRMAEWACNPKSETYWSM